MKGTILAFQEDRGVISCEEGNRYDFSIQEWKGENTPVSGMAVDFVVAENVATAIYQALPLDKKSTTPTAPSLVKGDTGAQAEQGQADQGQVRTSSLAIISLVFSLLGLLFFGSLIAIVCGHIAQHQIKKSNGMMTGNGMALAGLILGYLGFLYFIVMFVIGIVALISGDSYY